MWCCVCRQHCTEIEHQMGERESGPYVCMLEFYVLDKTKKGFRRLRLFVDDCDMSLENLDVEVF